MHVISMKKLREFWTIYPDSERVLRAWYKIAEHADWQNFNEIKQTCANSVDTVGDCIIFNISGNKYRLIVKIDFSWGKVFVRHVLTHKEYDRDLWKKDCC